MATDQMTSALENLLLYGLFNRLGNDKNTVRTGIPMTDGTLAQIGGPSLFGNQADGGIAPLFGGDGRGCAGVLKGRAGNRLFL